MSNDLNCRRLGCFFANLYNLYYVICVYDCVIVNVDECNASQPLLALGSHSQLVAGMVTSRAYLKQNIGGWLGSR